MNWTILTLRSVRLQVAQWLKRRENRLKLKIEVTEQHKARAAQVRARGRWVEKGQKNTKYFLNLENSTGNVKISDSLINKAAQLVTYQKDLMKMQRDYYAKSYRKNVSDVNIMDKINSILGNTRTPHLSQEQKKGCEGPFWEKKFFMHLNKWKMDLLQEMMEPGGLGPKI